MKWIGLFLALMLAVLGAVVPAHAQTEAPVIPARPVEGNYIVDELDWLTSEQEEGINGTLHRLDNDGIAEIAVVTLDDCGSDKTTFRRELFDRWGIGHTQDNDGLLILVCWYDGDPALRSVEQLFGRGLRGILSSRKTDQIAQEQFVPAFQQGNPGSGLVGMIRSYNLLLRTSGSANNSFANFWGSLSEWAQFTLVFLAMLAGVAVVDKLFPGMLRSNRDDLPYERDSDSREGGFDGGSSGGGGGSSTRL